MLSKLMVIPFVKSSNKEMKHTKAMFKNAVSEIMRFMAT